MTEPTIVDSTVKTDLAEYFAVTEGTTKLSHRRQTTNDILTGINMILLTAMGVTFVAGHLMSWWVTAIFSLITVFGWLIDITWIRLLNRFKRITGLRISYLEALERRLRDTNAFVDVEFQPENSKEPVKTRGVYTLEHQVLYPPGSHGGFTRSERFLVILFMVAYPLLTCGIAALTELIALHVILPVAL